MNPAPFCLPEDCPEEPVAAVVWAVLATTRAVVRALGVDPSSADAEELANNLMAIVMLGTEA